MTTQPGQWITGGVTLGGVWAVVKLAVHFQQNFTDKYIVRNRELETRVETVERKMRHCERRELQLIRALVQAGIALPPMHDVEARDDD